MCSICGAGLQCFQHFGRGPMLTDTPTLQHLVHTPTWLAVSAERAVSRMMGGSCSMPLAAYAQFDGEQLRIRAAWGDADGVQPVVYAHASGRVADTASAIALGEQVALALQEGVRAQTA